LFKKGTTLGLGETTAGRLSREKKPSESELAAYCSWVPPQKDNPFGTVKKRTKTKRGTPGKQTLKRKVTQAVQGVKSKRHTPGKKKKERGRSIKPPGVWRSSQQKRVPQKGVAQMSQTGREERKSNEG